MKSTPLVMLLVGVFLCGSVSVATAQQAESQLRLITEVHVKPGMVTQMVTQYEAAREEALTFMAQNKFPFRVAAFVTEGLV